MADEISLASTDHLADFATFLGRADKLGAAEAHLIGLGSALAVYVPVFTQQGLLDTTPTVLGLRIFERAGADESWGQSSNFDTVVSIRSLLDRIAHAQKLGVVELSLPPPEVGIAWAAIAPPVGGWVSAGECSQTELNIVAREGIAKVSETNGLGTNIVTTVRTEVWFSQLELNNDSGNPSAYPGVSLPKAVAFAGFGLGFLSPDAEPGQTLPMAQLTTSGAWKRLTTERGHLLVKGWN